MYRSTFDLAFSVQLALLMRRLRHNLWNCRSSKLTHTQIPGHKLAGVHPAQAEAARVQSRRAHDLAEDVARYCDRDIFP